MANRSPSPAESTRLPLRHPRRPDDEDESNADDEEEEAEVEKLQLQVEEMAQKLSSYRSTFPDQLRSGLAALLSSQRPQFPVLDPDSESGSARDLHQDAGSLGESSGGVIAAEEDQETAARVRMLKEKISSNISAMPLVLKRMNECISRIEKLNSCSDIIHPAFRRRKS